MNTLISTRDELLKELPKGLKIAELGTFEGSYGKLIWEYTSPSKLYLIDAFTDKTCYSGDKDGLNRRTRYNMEEVRLELKEYFKDYPDVSILKILSWDFLYTLEDDFLDMVYIDANHAYGAVARDLELSRKKVRNDGYITGHDYQPGGLFDEVYRAVNDFCDKYNLKIDCLTQDLLPSYVIINKK